MALDGLVDDKLVDGYIALAKEQIRTDYDIQTRDIVDRVSGIKKEFDKVGYPLEKNAEPKKGYFAKIDKTAGAVAEASMWGGLLAGGIGAIAAGASVIISHSKKASKLPVLSFVADTGKFLGGMFNEFYEKVRHATKEWGYNKKMARIKWAEDETESLNEIGKELKALANEYSVGLSYGNGAFGIETGDIGKEKSDEFFNRAESVGFIKKDDLLYLPGYQKLVKFMVKNSKQRRLTFLKRDDDSIKEKKYAGMFRIENLDNLKDQAEKEHTNFLIKSMLEEEHENLKKTEKIVREGYAELDNILGSSDFRGYLKKNLSSVQSQMGDMKELLMNYVYGGSPAKRKWKQYGLPVVGAFSKWITGVQLKNDKKYIDSAIKTLWGSDLYAILTQEQLNGRLSAKCTMANILNALPELKEALAEKCDENGLIALKIDNALTKEMSEKAMILAKNYHNIVRVPVYGIAHHFDAGADRKELLREINQDVRVVNIYDEIDSLAKDFRAWYSGLGFEHELTEDRGILRLFNEIKDDFKDRKRELTLGVFEKIINEGMESHMDGVTSIYRSKAKKFTDKYITERMKREIEFEGALDFFVDRFDNLFSISAYDPKRAGVIADKELESMIGKEVVSEAKNLIVGAYGRHSFVHSIQTMRAEKIQGMAQTLLMTGLLYKVVEEVTKSAGAAMFVGANFDDAFAGAVDAIESMTGTAAEHGKRIMHTAGGGLIGIGTALLAGLYFFAGGDMHVGSLTIPEVVKHGVSLGCIAAAGSVGALIGNTIYYKDSYKLLQEEGRMLSYVTDEDGKSIKKKLDLPFGELRTGFNEETTRPFIHGMFYIGLPTQIMLATGIALAAHYTGHHEILHNPVSVATVGFWESLAGFFYMINARKVLAYWTKGLNVNGNGKGLEDILKQTNSNSTPAAS